jgi:hypothetical protein
VDLGEHRARGDRRHDDVGELPPELLGDLEAQRLRALGVVRAEVHVHERPVELERELDAEARAVVVAAVDRVDLRAVHRGGDELLPLEVAGNEHDGVDALGRRARRDRVREVAGRRARERRRPELERLRACDRDDAILERVRRVRRVELQPELADAELLLEALRAHERCEAGREPLLRRRGDRQQVGVPPDRTGPRLDRLARHRALAVDGIEGAEALRADPDGIERHLGLADPAPECDSGHYTFSFRLTLDIQPGLAPHASCAGCRGVSGPVPSASLDVERDVLPAS